MASRVLPYVLQYSEPRLRTLMGAVFCGQSVNERPACHGSALPRSPGGQHPGDTELWGHDYTCLVGNGPMCCFRTTVAVCCVNTLLGTGAFPGERLRLACCWGGLEARTPRRPSPGAADGMTKAGDTRIER